MLVQNLALPVDAQTYITPDSGTEQAPNRYFVVMPKTGASSPGGGVLASRTNPQEYDGVICIAEFFTLSRCMRNSPNRLPGGCWQWHCPAQRLG
ncbi:MAG: hypothetical protein OHK0052_03270 [Anaerolineales bacterium]